MQQDLIEAISWPASNVSCGNANLPQCAKLEATDGFGKAIGIFLVVATLLASLPQALKLIKARSSEGVAPITLAIITTFGGSNLASTLVTSWRRFQDCSAHAPWPIAKSSEVSRGGAGCFFELLDAQQQMAAAIVFSSLLLLVTSLPPHNTCAERGIAVFTVAFLAALTAVSCVLSFAEPCGCAALTYAQVVGWLSAACAFTAYLPQLRDTWKVGGAGSLSPLFYLIQVIGCLLVNYNQIVVAHDPWNVWAPTAVSGLMQAAVLGLVIYFRLRPRSVVPLEGISDPMLPLPYQSATGLYPPVGPLDEPLPPIREALDSSRFSMQDKTQAD